MKKAIIFIRENDFMALEEAVNCQKEGYEIFLVSCDKAAGMCHRNPLGSQLICRLCTHMSSKFAKDLLKSSNMYHHLLLSQLITDDMLMIAKNERFSYQTVQELKDITYHGVDIGYGAFSTFVTVTRNVMPDFTVIEREIIDFMMKHEIAMTLAVESYINEINPDLIVFHNGRFNNLKPWYNLSQSKGLHFVATETYTKSDGTMMKDNYYNECPHSFEAIHKKILKAWKNCGKSGEEVGRIFFENRRNARPAGDVIYTKDQQQGLLPKNFNPNKRIITIFNSSEDEFFAISKEHDKALLFKNQFVGLKELFERYKTDNTIHFYLRIHPNLKSVPWRSHQDLYNLKYENVTIIPPTSPVSSYALLDVSNEIIVFGSTMGLEASYWGKPVINVVTTFYSKLGVVYEPKDIQEFYKYLDDTNLPSINKKRECYMAACYCMGYYSDNFEYYHNKIYQWHGQVYSLKKLLGSSKLFQVVNLLITKFSQYFGNGKRFRLLLLEKQIMNDYN